MVPYRNLSGKSGVAAYKLGSDYIIVEFRQGAGTFYKYTFMSAGTYAINNMKTLVVQGLGLNTYIKRNDTGYSAKGKSLASVE